PRPGHYRNGSSEQPWRFSPRRHGDTEAGWGRLNRMHLSILSIRFHVAFRRVPSPCLCASVVRPVGDVVSQLDAEAGSAVYGDVAGDALQVAERVAGEDVALEHQRSDQLRGVA